MKSTSKFTRFCIPCLVVIGLVLAMGSVAKADTVTTLYCTGGNTCYSNAADAGSSYWQFTSDMNASGGTFTFTLTVTAVNESTNAGLNHFSGQLSWGDVTSVSYVSGYSNGWTDVEANKGDNGGSCGGKAKGAFCGSSTGSTDISLGSNGSVTFKVTGTYDGTFNPDADWNFQASADNLTSGSGNAFALSLTVGPDSTIVPEPGSLMLFGTGLLGAAGFLRRKIFS
jgi:PEP-CTERM motif